MKAYFVCYRFKNQYDISLNVTVNEVKYKNLEARRRY